MKNKRRPSRAFNALFLILSIACFAYYLANGILIRFGQSLLWLWPFMGFALLTRFALVGYMIRTGRPSPLPRALLKIGHSLLAVLFALFFAVEGVILSGASADPAPGLDYVVVLGAKVNGTEPSGALRNRIQVASEYLLENPDTLCVASGGKGADEGISEALCILQGLTARGISADRVILEENSTDTVENIRFSLEKIPDADSAKIGVITNNFHIYRAMKIADTQKPGAFSPISVATSAFSLPHYLLREFAAVVVSAITGKW